VWSSRKRSRRTPPSTQALVLWSGLAPMERLPAPSATMRSAIWQALARLAAPSSLVTVDIPLPLGTFIDNTAVLSDAQGHSVQKEDSTQVTPGPQVSIVNKGAFATWQYGSGSYACASNPLLFGGLPVFLPLTFKYALRP